MISPDDRRSLLACEMRDLWQDQSHIETLCHITGIKPRIWRNATAGRPISADAHMTICAALSLDPVSIERLLSYPRTSSNLPGPICWATLGAGVRVARHLKAHSNREAAAAAGVSGATLSRCENGQVLSFDALARLAAYVGLHPYDYTARALGSTGNSHCNALQIQEAAR